MNKTLHAIIEHVLEHPNTKTNVEMEKERAGYYIYNEDLNISISIFSDKQQSYYFQFSYMKTLDDTKMYSDHPTYKTQTLSEVRPILELVHKRIELRENFFLDRATFYMAAFKNLLRKEAITHGFTIDENKFRYDLNENNKVVAYLEKSDLIKTAELAEQLSEPTTLLIIPMRGIHNVSQMLNLYIPKYEISEYPLLKSEIKLKNSTTSTYSLDEVIDNLLSSKDTPKTQFHEILKFAKLDNELSQKSIPITSKKVKAKV